MNIIEYNNNIANDDDINNEGEPHIMSDIYMFLNIVRYTESMVCKKKSKIWKNHKWMGLKDVMRIIRYDY